MLRRWQLGASRQSQRGGQAVPWQDHDLILLHHNSLSHRRMGVAYLVGAYKAQALSISLLPQELASRLHLVVTQPPPRMYQTMKDVLQEMIGL